MNLPAEQVSRVAQAVTTADEIEDLAVQVRTAWKIGLGPICNMVNLLESRGHEGRPVVFLVMEKGSTSRTRFDACHELGHLVMHADATPGSPDLERQASYDVGKLSEATYRRAYVQQDGRPDAGAGRAADAAGEGAGGGYAGGDGGGAGGDAGGGGPAGVGEPAARGVSGEGDR